MKFDRIRSLEDIDFHSSLLPAGKIDAFSLSTYFPDSTVLSSLSIDEKGGVDAEHPQPFSILLLNNTAIIVFYLDLFFDLSVAPERRDSD